MEQDEFYRQKIFLLDYDKATNEEILANIVVVDLAQFEYNVTQKLKFLAKVKGKKMRRDAIKTLLLEAYRRRIDCLMSMMEVRNDGN